MRRRAREHRGSRGSAFTSKYVVNLLVWFEEIEDEAKAFQRERTLKEWPRHWKINLVERGNRDYGFSGNGTVCQPAEQQIQNDPAKAEK